MKKWFVILLLSLSYMFAVDTIASLNEVQLGSSSTLLKNKVKISEAEKNGKVVVCYSKNDENLERENTKLDVISYCYNEDRLFMIQYIINKDYTDEALKNMISKKLNKEFKKYENAQNFVIMETKGDIVEYIVSTGKYQEKDVIYFTHMPSFK